jgi:O-antigen ligase
MALATVSVLFVISKTHLHQTGLKIPHSKSIYILAPLLFAGGAVSGSRGFILAFMIGVLVIVVPLFVRYSKQVLSGLALVVVLFHLAVLSSEYSHQRMANVFPYLGKLADEQAEIELKDFVPVISDESLGGRAVIWRRAFSLWSENPLLGVSNGGFKVSEGAQNTINNTHNYVVQVFVDSGLIGLGIIVLLVIKVARRVKPAQWPVVLAAVGSLQVENYLDHSLPWILGAAWLITNGHLSFCSAQDRPIHADWKKSPGPAQ